MPNDSRTTYRPAPRSGRSPGPVSPAASLMLSCLVSLVSLLAISSGAIAQSEPKSPATPAGRVTGSNAAIEPRATLDMAGKVGPGQPAPDFELDGSRGSPVRLSSLRGGWVMLAFAATRESVGVISGLYGPLSEQSIQLVGVCHDKARSVEKYARLTRTPVLILADATGQVSAMYGLWDALHGSTIAGYVLIDSLGVVRASIRGRSMPLRELEDLAIETTGHP